MSSLPFCDYIGGSLTPHASCAAESPWHSIRRYSSVEPTPVGQFGPDSDWKFIYEDTPPCSLSSHIQFKARAHGLRALIALNYYRWRGHLGMGWATDLVAHPDQSPSRHGFYIIIGDGVVNWLFRGNAAQAARQFGLWYRYAENEPILVEES